MAKMLGIHGWTPLVCGMIAGVLVEASEESDSEKNAILNSFREILKGKSR